MNPSQFRRTLIAVAGGLYLIVAVGCMIKSSARPLEPVSTDSGGRLVPLTGLPYRGVAMQIQRPDWLDRPSPGTPSKYEECIDEMVKLGADTFLCVVDARQENGSSERIYLDMRMTPTPEKLGALIAYAKSKNLRVILMPIVLLDAPRGDEWRGKINPPSWGAWFESYRNMLNHFAWIAQSYRADVMVVGSELVSTETHADEWKRTISMVRDNFKGQLTYSSNWDHYADIPFWDQLDIIGMNSYWKLGRDHNVPVSEVVERWQTIQGQLKSFSDRKGKPILLLEAGWCSIANAAHEPWDYTQDKQPIDFDLQKRLWQGFFEAWQGKPWMAGYMVWAWSPGDGGEGYSGSVPDKVDQDVLDQWRGYTPKNKPAYDVIKTWLAKPWIVAK